MLSDTRSYTRYIALGRNDRRRNGFGRRQISRYGIFFFLIYPRDARGIGAADREVFSIGRQIDQRRMDFSIGRRYDRIFRLSLDGALFVLVCEKTQFFRFCYIPSSARNYLAVFVYLIKKTPIFNRSFHFVCIFPNRE